MCDETVSFNLIDMPWIKGRDISGNTCEYSIMELFRNASNLTSLTNDLPTQDFAILRVLEAILQRSLTSRVEDYEFPADLWGALWDAKELPLDDIEEYLQRWHHRFDLLDDEEPFMQVAGMHTTNGQISDVKKIMADVPDGSALFSMRSGESLSELTFAEAARWVIHAQAFDTAGIKTGVAGDPSAKGGKSYPIGTSWAGSIGGIYLEGNDLLETLLLNLCLCLDCRDDPDAFFDLWDDLPVWEQQTKAFGAGDNEPRGYADLYTWQSRRMLLFRRSDTISGVLLTNGDKLEAYNKRRFEPMTAWRHSIPQEKKLKIVPVYLPKTHRKERALWRGLTSILPSADGQSAKDFIAPGVAYWAGYLASNNGGKKLSTEYQIRMHATGFEYGVQNSVISEMIDDTLQLNALLLSPEGIDAVNVAKECMAQTDSAVGALGYLAKQLKLATCDNSGLASEAARSAMAEAYYELDGQFRRWLAGLRSDGLQERRQQWFGQARRTIAELGDALVKESDSNTITGRKVGEGANAEWICAGRAEAQFWHLLAKALPLEKREHEKESGVK